MKLDGRVGTDQDDAMTEFPVPQEVRELFDESLAARECRDACIASVFKARRAIYFGKRHIQAAREAWALVRELWPQTERGAWQYDQERGVVKAKQ